MATHPKLISSSAVQFPPPETQKPIAVEERLPASAVRIREATLCDYRGIAAVEARNGLPAKNREEWEHLWVNNPAFRRMPRTPIGWVAENHAGEVVGYFGNIPLSFNFQGREILAGAVHSMNMDPPYRGHAGFLLKRYLSQKTEFLLATTANENSSKFGLGTRNQPVPAGDWSQASFWVTNVRGFMESTFARKRWPKLLSHPASLLWSLRERISKSQAWTMDDTRNVEIISEFDERFDDFWEELKNRYPNRLLANRSQEVLQWHFKYALARGRVWIAAISNGSGLQGYAIFLRQDRAALGLRRVRLIDFQTLEGSAEMLVPMLAWAVRRCESEGIHMLEAFGFRADKQDVINRFAPYRRHLPAWMYFFQTRNKELLQQLRSPDVWDPCQFDGDATL